MIESVDILKDSKLFINNLLFNLYLSEKIFPDRPDFLHGYVFWVVIVPYDKIFLIRDRDRGIPGVRKFRKITHFWS